MQDLHEKNKRVMRLSFLLVFGMIALSFASVPLYRMICQVTGWGGTTQRAALAPVQIFDREIVVRFNADTNPDLPWDFKPEVRQVTVKVGADKMVSYRATNTSDKPVTGTAVFNVTPLRAGKYFNKTQCFCFSEQTLGPGQSVNMPVVFFIDPKIMDDKDLADLKTVTLSYTFYPHNSSSLDKAIENFIGASDNPT